MAWLDTAPHAVCPLCKAALARNQLSPNWGLRKAVDQYTTLSAHPPSAPP
jgi:hypothetical protein